MSFPKDSAWAERDNLAAYHDAQRRRNRSAVPQQPHEAAPKTAAIPYPVLENWIGSLEVAENGGDIEDVLIDMRSYFRG
jgi:hypothetical protein